MTCSVSGQVARLPRQEGLDQRTVRQFLFGRSTRGAERVPPPESNGAERLPSQGLREGKERMKMEGLALEGKDED
jgi:hypothetical protein